MIWTSVHDPRLHDLIRQRIREMEIISIRNSTLLPDGRMKKEYRLSSPVTDDILAAISKGDFIKTGYQYLSPTDSIMKGDGFEISGILRSPIITVICPPSLSAGIEDYLISFISTIPDSEKPESSLSMMIQSLKSSSCVHFFTKG